ncbi:PadR family transcriptional regulator [Rhizocola hellebori]|uniref:PadR family transcriptional regulator n=1 Tax=Rhizocola hellebori TaxID=1392758 RepID=A0A8J3VIW7_9ACTN|nr:PadR family transcriptional regulator [Rhizocola hellebori]GIH07827.1 PadR family transcriptional regulator [Rhizocola hellebori]
MTLHVARVLAVFLSDVDNARYGVDLMEQSGLGSGTIYPILQKLQAAGWVSSEWEQEDPTELGRPVRRYYLLTPHGAEQARQRLAELHQSTAPAPVTGRVVKPA